MSLLNKAVVSKQNALHFRCSSVQDAMHCNVLQMCMMSCCTAKWEGKLPACAGYDNRSSQLYHQPEGTAACEAEQSTRTQKNSRLQAREMQMRVLEVGITLRFRPGTNRHEARSSVGRSLELLFRSTLIRAKRLASPCRPGRGIRLPLSTGGSRQRGSLSGQPFLCGGLSSQPAASDPSPLQFPPWTAVKHTVLGFRVLV